MRLVPFLTAILVTVGLYLLVFERDKLMAFAKAEAATTLQDETAAKTASNTTDQTASSVMRVVVQRSEANEIDSAVILRGQTRAIRQVDVRSETTSTVLSEPKRKGTFVTAGDMLCELDPGTRPAQLAEAKARKAQAESSMPEADARLAEAKARLEEARINNNAAQKLAETGYASETRRISTQAAVSSAEAGIKSAEAGLETSRASIEAATAAVAAAQREIDRLTIEAPFQGLLESDTAELGSLMQPGSLCATIIQLNPIKVVGYVPETAVNRVQVGALAGAELATGLQVQGRVTFLSRSADPNTRTFEVEVTVDNPELLIRDGQTATIAISSDGAKAHRLPQSALTLNNDGQLGVRTVGQGNIVAFVPVEVVRDTPVGVWLTGLPETADVIVVGQDYVIEGVTVEPTWREASE
ncbi:efflux RND transporter periplasmic adaptor subunit [Ruegeria sp. WL0004]|uniref:Efflux RND transporter periplasmic adaptor subunit n=1 Tax=Ruegeria marisflavi TaxID=2984152 RepID=A0ABT2WQ47_9RHOB|nr:efflux RND transporter periplasmic adaptor subunit [Ruegeria sp. WL0004]MCU9838023.1 efflux RND transporter periplasmic adaptor subunit [Ruegeria sp. WL0004]